MAVDKVIFDTKDCTGCKTCAIACSYHHRAVFSLGLSSIEIKDRRQEGKFAIVFYKRDEDGHLGCDKCKGEEELLCMKYCNFLARDELRTFLDAI
jgi:Fe-S-cluster-containing hydrogenase component 2